ncbi:Mechanosensitive ion channel protein 9, partial [Bienertia sinuspersici]
MEYVRNQCRNLENVLGSATEFAKCLDKIISWILVGAIFIMWLLLTGLASTKILVIIASPLLAATFIFGETCKTLFEGIIFVFVVHPFDIGDTCEIEQQKLEVTSIGVWTTIFSKLDDDGRRQQDVVIYPNKELNNKVIIINKIEFDWSDDLEFHMEATIKDLVPPDNYDKLAAHINEMLKDYKLPIQSNSLQMEIQGVMHGCILFVNLQYTTTIINDIMTNYDRVWLKEKLRDEVKHTMKKIIRDLTA